MRLALLLLAAACSGCFDDSPPTGQCTGFLGATNGNLTIDPESEFHVRSKLTCAELDQTLFHLSYGSGALQVAGQMNGLVSIAASQTFTLPAPSGALLQWHPSSGAADPEVLSGTLHLRREASSRVTGDFQIAFKDDSSITCDLSLPVRSDLTEGDSPDCGSGDSDD